MSSNTISGTNFSLDGSVVDFFGAKGARLSDDGWAINALGGDLMFEAPKSNETPQTILQFIKDDTDAGKRDEIAYVIVDARAAVVLYLNGIITAEHLREASEGPHDAPEGPYYVDIPGVVFDGLPLTVRVDGRLIYRAYVATADKDCIVI